ncbi:matrixin family metalloprotease [Thiolapillus sp.]
MKKNGLNILPALLFLLLTAPASAYVLMGLQWPGNQTTIYPDFVLYGDRSSLSGVSWNQAFREAAGDWNAHSPFQLQIDTTNPSHPCAGLHDNYPGDGYRNGAAFHDKYCSIDDDGNPETVDFGKKTLAITVNYSFQYKPDEIVESDMFFNTAQPWDIYNGLSQSRFDFRRVALHELGHTLGLDHEESNPAIMAPTIGNIYTLQADDIAGLQTLYGNSTDPGTPPIRMSIEEPFDGDVKSGVSTFRGWVVSKNPLSSLTLYRNGTLFGNLDHDGKRVDVGGKYPDYPGSVNSGFSFATNFGALPAGQHQYRLVARDNQGNTLEKTVSFRVERFDNSWVADENRISLDNASIYSPGGNDIQIDRMQHDGKEYSLILRWKKARQGFDPIEIVRTK